jgi:hypothetical protein
VSERTDPVLLIVFAHLATSRNVTNLRVAQSVRRGPARR